MKNIFLLLVWAISSFVFYKNSLANIQNDSTNQNLQTKKETTTSFKGRISKANTKLGIFKIITDYENRSYLTIGLSLQLLRPDNQDVFCEGEILGKASKINNDVLLIKISKWKECQNRFYLVVGQYLQINSQELTLNLQKGSSFQETLLKKQLALESMKKDIRAQLQKEEAKEISTSLFYDKEIKNILGQKEEAIKKIQETRYSLREKLKKIDDSEQKVRQNFELYKIRPSLSQEQSWSIDSSDIRH